MLEVMRLLGGVYMLSIPDPKTGSLVFGQWEIPSQEHRLSRASQVTPYVLTGHSVIQVCALRSDMYTSDSLVMIYGVSI